MELGDHPGNDLTVQLPSPVGRRGLETLLKVYCPLAHDVIRRDELRPRVVHGAVRDNVIDIRVTENKFVGCELRKRNDVDLPLSLLSLPGTLGKHKFMRTGGGNYTGCCITLREFRVGVFNRGEPSTGADLDRDVKGCHCNN